MIIPFSLWLLLGVTLVSLVVTVLIVASHKVQVYLGRRLPHLGYWAPVYAAMTTLLFLISTVIHWLSWIIFIHL